jgi:glycosyltransferase involved in cell wall biosynthesis
MKVAVVHDDLMRRGGAEQVVLSIMKAFPEADLYTLCYQPELTYPEFKKYRIKTSVFQFIAKTEKRMKWLFFPFGIISMKLLAVKGYDVVIISNTFCGKYVLVDKKAKVFIYTYTPFRLAWDPTSYKEYNESKGLKKILFDAVIKCLRVIDKGEARKGHFHLGMTAETAERIKKAYDVPEVCIIPPPVKCENFYLNPSKEKNYYLLVSRLEFYKKVDLAIEAFNELRLPLIVVGNGSKKKELQAMAKKNIEFKSGLSSSQLADLYANCKAFVFPQHEDYGITPLESNASGRPVVAFAKGGVLETMIPYTGSKNYTSVFFEEQTVSSLIEAIKKLETIDINSEFIRSHSLKFDEPVFIQKLLKKINCEFETWNSSLKTSDCSSKSEKHSKINQTN